MNGIRIAAVAFAALILTGCSLTLFEGGSRGGSKGGSEPFSVSSSVFLAQTNQIRAEAGLPPVRWSGKLAQIAQKQAKRIAKADRLSHDIGGSLPRRLMLSGYPWQAAAENISYGYNSSADAMAGWINSPGHLKNLKNPRVTEIGVGAVRQKSGKRRVFWAMILATPASTGPLRSR